MRDWIQGYTTGDISEAERRDEIDSQFWFVWSFNGNFHCDWDSLKFID